MKGKNDKKKEEKKCKESKNFLKIINNHNYNFIKCTMYVGGGEA